MFAFLGGVAGSVFSCGMNLPLWAILVGSGASLGTSGAGVSLMGYTLSTTTKTWTCKGQLKSLAYHASAGLGAGLATGGLSTVAMPLLASWASGGATIGATTRWADLMSYKQKPLTIKKWLAELGRGAAIGGSFGLGLSVAAGGLAHGFAHVGHHIMRNVDPSLHILRSSVTSDVAHVVLRAPAKMIVTFGSDKSKKAHRLLEPSSSRSYSNMSIDIRCQDVIDKDPECKGRLRYDEVNATDFPCLRCCQHTDHTVAASKGRFVCSEAKCECELCSDCVAEVFDFMVQEAEMDQEEKELLEKRKQWSQRKLKYVKT